MAAVFSKIIKGAPGDIKGFLGDHGSCAPLTKYNFTFLVTTTGVP